jgi:hypothetical protein
MDWAKRSSDIRARADPGVLDLFEDSVYQNASREANAALAGLYAEDCSGSKQAGLALSLWNDDLKRDIVA